MKLVYIIVILLLIIILFIMCQFIIARINLLTELKHCKRKGAITDYHFKSKLSLFSGIEGETSDLQLIIGDKIVLVKLIGGVRRRIRYEISEYNIWNVYRYLPFILPFLLDPIGIKKVFQVKFDLKKEKILLQSESQDKEIEMAYLFCPPPISVKEISHKKEQELLGGDMCHGVRILTKKTLRNAYMNYK